MSESGKIKKDIEAEGGDWVFIKRTTKTGTQEWRPALASEKQYPLKAIEVLVGNANLLFDKHQMPEEVKGLLVSVFEVEPDLNDSFKKDGKIYSIKKIAKIRPANEVLLYRMVIYL